MTDTLTPPTRVLSREQVDAFHRNGYHLARQLFTPAEVREIRDTFMAMNANGPVEGLSEMRRNSAPNGYSAADPLAFYPRMMHPHRHADKPVGPLAMRYMLDPRLEAHLADLFGDEPIAAQSMFYFKPPGARGQDFHQDNFYLRVKPGTCMAAWVAVDDCDEENGAMMVVPTTGAMDIVCPEASDSALFFTTEHVPIPEGQTAVPCIMKAGDVLFFNGSIIHGSYPNTSKTRFRRSFICHYVPKGCAEVAHWYRPLLSFRGEEVLRETAVGGGPCGTAEGAVKGPH
jgi:ectoine hydroxylase-related dioxygenase (phytanoyl-CoA dioxygenase family)